MRISDRLVAWNARQTMRLTIPIVLLKAAAGFILAGFVLAILVPVLHDQGIALRAWMVWFVIAGLIALCAGPDVYRWFTRSGARPVHE